MEHIVQKHLDLLEKSIKNEFQICLLEKIRCKGRCANGKRCSSYGPFGFCKKHVTGEKCKLQLTYHNHLPGDTSIDCPACKHHIVGINS